MFLVFWAQKSYKKLKKQSFSVFHINSAFLSFWLSGSYASVKSRKLKQTGKSSRSFRKARSSEKLSLYGKLKSSAF